MSHDVPMDALAPHGHLEEHGHHDDHHDGEVHGTMRDYVIGFVLSVILTAIPFWLVMARPLDGGTTAVIIMGLAAVQMIVHMVFFLHMTPKAEGGWSMTALIFTIIIVGIMLAGSLWVMFHLNTNMMPTHEMTSQLP
jgi:cytochrome o ubiquinol oxidase operon protein cyoD